MFKLLATALLAVVAPHAAAVPGFSVTVVPLAGGASLQSGAGASVADLGTVSSYVRTTSPGVTIVRRAQSYVVVTSIGLRANAPAGQTAVSLEGFLDTDIPGVTVRIDGVTMVSIPRVFAARVTTNAVTRHRLEIEIPNTLDPSRVPSEIPLEFGATAQ